jgi:hypothetical protein
MPTDYITGYQAIMTRHLSPSNVRGAHVKATTSAGSVTLPWNHALNADANHLAAARALADKFAWQGVLIGGGLSSADMCFVMVDERSAQLAERTDIAHSTTCDATEAADWRIIEVLATLPDIDDLD